MGDSGLQDDTCNGLPARTDQSIPGSYPGGHPKIQGLNNETAHAERVSVYTENGSARSLQDGNSEGEGGEEGSKRNPEALEPTARETPHMYVIVMVGV